MGLKIAVVGGGSTYTPELVQGFATRRTGCLSTSWSCTTSTPSAWEWSPGWPGACWPGSGGPGACADRPPRGGHRRGRLRGRATPGRRAGHAPGGRDPAARVRLRRPGDNRARRLRQGPAHRPGRARAGRGDRAPERPGAWFVDFTNPVGIVTQALLDRGYRAIGLCNSAIGFQRRFAAWLGVAPEQVELEHVGLNHLTWERAVGVDGTDRLPELLADHGEELADDLGLQAALLRLLGAVPSHYLRYYYATGQVLDEQRRGPSRAQQVAEIERRLLELCRDPALDTKPELLERRGGAFYSEAAAALIASLHAGTGDVQVVDVRNDGALPACPTTPWSRSRPGRRRRRPPPAPRPARPRAPRPGPAGQGVRAPGRGGGGDRRPHRRPQGAAGQPTGPRVPGGRPSPTPAGGAAAGPWTAPSVGRRSTEPAVGRRAASADRHRIR